MEIGYGIGQGDANIVGEAIVKIISGTVCGTIGAIGGGLVGETVGTPFGKIGVKVGGWTGRIGGATGGGYYGENYVGKSVWSELSQSQGKNVDLNLGFTTVQFSLNALPKVAGSSQVVPLQKNVTQIVPIASTANTKDIDIVKVSPNGAQQVVHGQSRLTPDRNAGPSSANYTVQKGDTLSRLAWRDGVTVADYLKANPQITTPDLIREGQVINKPVAAYKGVNNTPANSGTLHYNSIHFNQHAATEYRFHQFRQNGGVEQIHWNSFTSGTSNWLLGGGWGLKPGGGEGFKLPSHWGNPIGAFYDSQSTTYDNAVSIAHKTTQAMNTNGQMLSASDLAALDTNHDGGLSAAETVNVRLWSDVNEDGYIDSNELLNTPALIKNTDYAFYTRRHG